MVIWLQRLIVIRVDSCMGEGTSHQTLTLLEGESCVRWPGASHSTPKGRDPKLETHGPQLGRGVKLAVHDGNTGACIGAGQTALRPVKQYSHRRQTVMSKATALQASKLTGTKG